MTPLLLLTSSLAFALSVAAPPGACPAQDAWPSPDWSVSKEKRDTSAIDAYLFSPSVDWADTDRKGVRTDGIVIVHHGQVVYERYANGHTADTPHLAWSAAKSFTNALIGIAVREELVDIDDSICDYIDVRDRDNCAIHVVDLMEFSSGFDWRESYEGQSPVASSVLAMLYGQGQPDMASFVVNHPRRDKPGTTWMYSSGDTNVLAAVARAALEPKFGDRFPWDILFEPIGMDSAVWERDGAGTYVGSSYLYATPRDFARFGWLLLNDGCWQGERLLPEGWIAASTQVNEPFKTRPLGYDGGPVQGRQFWLNRAVPEIGHDALPWPDAPEGTFAPLGHWKQSIYVVPQAGLVIARNGDDRDGSYEHNETIRLALELVGFEHEGSEPGEWTAPVAEDVGAVRKYDNSLFRLASGFSAQEVCSCIFVMGRDEDFCAQWTRVSPDVAKFKVDYDSKTVRARALGMGKTNARYTDAQNGCVIVD